MKLGLLIIGLLFALVGCSTPEKSAPAGAPVAEAHPVKNWRNFTRKPALHIYASSTCKAEGGIELAYDGPGSNYAVGGFSHVYKKKGKAKVKALAYEPSPEDMPALGEEIADEKLEVHFAWGESKRVGKERVTPKAGQKCEPEEYDYQTTEFSSESFVEFTDMTAEAADRLGLKKGQKIKFKCANSESIPIRCPKGGRWTKEDLAN